MVREAHEAGQPLETVGLDDLDDLRDTPVYLESREGVVSNPEMSL